MTPPDLIVPLFATVLLVASIGLVLVATAPVRVAARRRIPGRRGSKDDKMAWIGRASDYLVSKVDYYAASGRWIPVTAHHLEIAGIASSPGSVIVTAVAAAAAAGAIVLTVTQQILLAIIMAGLVLVAAKSWLQHKIDKRRKKFGAQLDEILQVLASSLRAGHSFPAAMGAVAASAEPPAREEFVRIINEHRIGRDLIDAMAETATRMDSQDFLWISEAVAIQRETGGNLNEILDRVAATIAARRELQQDVAALSAEGRLSGWVLMGIPPALVLLLTLINPGFINPLFTTVVGQLVIGGSAIMYIIGGLWIRKVVEVKF